MTLMQGSCPWTTGYETLDWEGEKGKIKELTGGEVIFSESSLPS